MDPIPPDAGAGQAGVWRKLLVEVARQCVGGPALQPSCFCCPAPGPRWQGGGSGHPGSGGDDGLGGKGLAPSDYVPPATNRGGQVLEKDPSRNPFCKASPAPSADDAAGPAPNKHRPAKDGGLNKKERMKALIWERGPYLGMASPMRLFPVLPTLNSACRSVGLTGLRSTLVSTMRPQCRTTSTSTSPTGSTTSGEQA